MPTSRSTHVLILVTVAAVFMTLSNTVGDGNLFGGIAFFIWALAVLGLLTLGVRCLLERRSSATGDGSTAGGWRAGIDGKP